MSDATLTTKEIVITPAPTCSKCGAKKFRRACFNCGGRGVVGYAPDDYGTCDVCEGEAWWFSCRNCEEENGHD